MFDNDIVSTKQRTMESIKKNFLLMYKNKPLKEIKVSDLIRACNISRGTFYFHFEDIYALYCECEQDMIGFLEAGLSDVILSTVGMDYNKHIKILSKDLKRYVEHIDMFQCFLSGSEEVAFRQAWFDSICRNYGKSMEFSHSMPLSKQKNIIRFYAGGHLALLSNWVLEGCKEPAEDIAHISAQVLFEGAFLKTNDKKTR